MRFKLLSLILFFLFLPKVIWADTWVVSSYPLAKIWRELFVEEKLYFLAPPKGEFHFLEPSPKDWDSIRKAEFVILVGSEPWAKKVYQFIPKEKVFSLAEPSEKLPDPHLWFDFPRVERLIKNFLNHPKVKEKSYYEKAKERAEDFLKKLRELQGDYKNLSQCRVKEFYSIGHRVFYYLFVNTGIKENSLIRGHHHGEISTRTLKTILTEAKKKGINKILLAEREFAKYKDIFIREGFQVYEVWSGDYEVPGLFLQLMQENLEVFKNLLGCN